MSKPTRKQILKVIELVKDERKPKDNQGDWEGFEAVVEECLSESLFDGHNQIHDLYQKKADDLEVQKRASASFRFHFKKIKNAYRELLKRQKEEIVVKAEGYRNSYDALGKFIEDLSNS